MLCRSWIFESISSVQRDQRRQQQGGADKKGGFHAHSCSFKLVGLMKMRMGLARLVSADCSDAKGIAAGL